MTWMNLGNAKLNGSIATGRSHNINLVSLLPDPIFMSDNLIECYMYLLTVIFTNISMYK